MANENDINGKVGLDVTDFKAAVADLNRQIRVVESGFKAVAAGMDDWRTTSDGLQNRIVSLNKVVDLQKQKITNLKAEYDKIAESKGKDSKAAQDLEVRINKETASLNKNELELKNCEKSLDELKNKSNEAGKGIKNLGDEEEKAAKKSSSLRDSLKNLGTHLGSGMVSAAKVTAGAMVGLGVAAAGAAVGIFKLSESASDLVEAQNVVEQTFKSSAKSIEAWTDTTANSAGISKTMSTQWVGSMGAMLKSSGLSIQAAGDMSKTLVQLDGDMSSFYNVANSDMWEAIRSGISGETEPLKRFGINMSVANLSAFALSQGIKKSYNEMSQAEQTTLRYNYLLSVTKDAQGDFNRTLGNSFANQLRVVQMNLQSLGMSIGQIFLPAVMDMTKGLNEAFSKINQLLGDGFQNSDLSKISTIITGLLQKTVNGIAAFLPKAVPVIVQTLNGLIASIIQVLPTLLPPLLQGAISLINGLITLIQQNVQPIVGLATNLITQFATFILQTLPQLIPVAVQIIVALINGLTQMLPQLVPMAIQMIITLANAIISNIGTIINAGITLLLALAQGIANQLPTLIQEAPRIINSLSAALMAQLPKILAAGVQILLILIKGIISSIPTLIANLPQIILAIVNVITLFNWASLGKSLITKIGEGINSMVAFVSNIARGVANNTGNTIINVFKGGLTWGRNFISNIGSGISSMAGSISSMARSIANGALNSIKNVFAGAINIGKNLVQGIVQGIKNGAGYIAESAASAAGNALTAAKKKLGINSPSRVMRDEVGQFIPAGIALGISDNAKQVDAAMAGLSNKLSGNFATSLNVNAKGTSDNNNAVLETLSGLIDALKNYTPVLNLDGQTVAVATGPYDNKIQGQYNETGLRRLGI